MTHYIKSFILFYLFLNYIIFIQFVQSYPDSTGYLLTSAAGHGGGEQVNQESLDEGSEAFFNEEYDFAEEDYMEPGIAQASTSRNRNRPSSGQQQLNFGDSSNPLFDKESIFEQGKQIGTYGETRDFLAFLRRIQYDHRQCPDINGKPVDIDVSIVVSNIRAVSEVTMDYALELFYRETWTDPRLRYNKALFKNKTELALHESYTNFLWHPDTFMPNAIASKNPMKHSISHRSLLRLQETGRVLYSRRISIVAECPMDLTLFPFDSQNCKLGIESYGYTADQVKYKWSTGAISSLTLQKIRLPDFQIKQAYVTSQMESYATGDYSRLYVCFVFTRSSGFCFLQLIIPSTAVVITSWVSLWMESESEFQDMVSIILAITFLIFSYNEMMPRVSYIKAMDVYLGVCFMIVFLSLIKLSFFKYLRQKLKISRDKAMVQGFLPILRVESACDDHNMNGSINGNGISSPTGSALTADVDNNLCRRGSFQYTAVPIPNEGEEPAAQLFTSAAKHKTFSKFIPKWEFTTKTVQRLHWISQMIFFFFFVSFVLFFFIFYPNLHFVPIDPACLKEQAEWHAEIP